jgi:hypothetical protein
MYATPRTAHEIAGRDRAKQRARGVPGGCVAWLVLVVFGLQALGTSAAAPLAPPVAEQREAPVEETPESSRPAETTVAVSSAAAVARKAPLRAARQAVAAQSTHASISPPHAARLNPSGEVRLRNGCGAYLRC